MLQKSVTTYEYLLKFFFIFVPNAHTKLKKNSVKLAITV